MNSDFSEKCLAIAEACKPALQESRREPLDIVRLHENPSAFQGWEMRRFRPAGKIINQPLSEGDAVILDFGEHIVGYLHLHLAFSGSAMGGPLRLKLIFGEVPAEIAGPFDPYDGALSRAWLQDEVITIDQLPQQLKLPRRYAFRYLKLEVMACSFDYQLLIRDIFCKTVTAAKVPIENFVEEKIPEAFREMDLVALRTLRNCMQSVLEDGPKRDRRLWLADSPLMAQIIYQTFKQYELYKRCLFLFAGLAYEDGRIPACVYLSPTPHKGGEFILDFSVMFAAYLLDYAENSGDWDSAEQLWPTALRQVEFVKEYLDSNALYQDRGRWWIFIDWQKDLDKQAAMQGLFIHALKNIYQLAEKLSKTAEVNDLPNLIKKMEKAAKKLRSKDAPGLFLSGPEHQISWASQVWMIIAGVVDKKAAGKILQTIISHPTALKPATPFIYHYAVEAMLQCDMKSDALNLLQAYWGRMISLGASTFWEVFDPQDHFSSPYNNHFINSYCHSWSCTPAYLLRKIFCQNP